MLSVKRESVMRFSSLGFFHESLYPGPLSILLGPLLIFTKIHEDMCNFVFTGVIDNGDKLYIAVNHTSNKLSHASFLPVIN